MRIILASIMAVILLAVAAGLIFARTQKLVYEARALPTVRIDDDPGHNLVGPDWSGLPTSSAPEQASHVTRRELGAATPE
jgi:uncharacterized protein involved in exopolysaccharide biosynthesis